MSLRIEIVVSDPKSEHAFEPVFGDPIEDPRNMHSEIPLHKRGVRGALLFDGGESAQMAGELVAVYHHRRGYPDWTRLQRDPREAWIDLPSEARKQLFALDLSGGHPDVDVSLADVSHVPGDSPFRPIGVRMFDDHVSEDLNLLGDELACFLWVLREFERQHGEPLKLDREDDDVPRF